MCLGKAPAQRVVRYETVEFGKYFEDKSPYTKMPSKELDDKWEDLYNCEYPYLHQQGKFLMKHSWAQWAIQG